MPHYSIRTTAAKAVLCFLSSESERLALIQALLSRLLRAGHQGLIEHNALHGQLLLLANLVGQIPAAALSAVLSELNSQRSPLFLAFSFIFLVVAPRCPPIGLGFILLLEKVVQRVPALIAALFPLLRSFLIVSSHPQLLPSDSDPCPPARPMLGTVHKHTARLLCSCLGRVASQPAASIDDPSLRALLRFLVTHPDVNCQIEALRWLATSSSATVALSDTLLQLIARHDAHPKLLRLALVILQKQHPAPPQNLSLWQDLARIATGTAPAQLQVEAVTYMGVFIRHCLAAPQSSVILSRLLAEWLQVLTRYADAAQPEDLRIGAARSLEEGALPLLRGAQPHGDDESRGLILRAWLICVRLLCDEAQAIRKLTATAVTAALQSAPASDFRTIVLLAAALHEHFGDLPDLFEYLLDQVTGADPAHLDPLQEEWGQTRILFQAEPENIWIEPVFLLQVFGWRVVTLLTQNPSLCSRLDRVPALAWPRWLEFSQLHRKDYSPCLFYHLYKALFCVFLTDLRTDSTLLTRATEITPLQLVSDRSDFADVAASVHPLLSKPFFFLQPWMAP